MKSTAGRTRRGKRAENAVIGRGAWRRVGHKLVRGRPRKWRRGSHLRPTRPLGPGVPSAARFIDLLKRTWFAWPRPPASPNLRKSALICGYAKEICAERSDGGDRGEREAKYLVESQVKVLMNSSFQFILKPTFLAAQKYNQPRLVAKSPALHR